MLSWISSKIAYPLVERRDPHRRMALWRELDASQWWPAERLCEQQAERLRGMLRYAYDRCPFYRRRFDEAKVAPHREEVWSALSRLPVLTKDEIRAAGDELFSSEYDRRSLVQSKTGGSTGTALVIFADRQCQAQRNAAAFRSDHWGGWRPGYVRGAVWGNPPAMNTWRLWLKNTFYDRHIALDTMNLDPSTMSQFAERCRRLRSPLVLFGHAHSIYIFASFLEESGVPAPRPRGIIATSMSLMPRERAVMERVFGCRVHDRYGCEEVGLIAAQCDRFGPMHVNADHVVVELLDDEDQPVAPGQDGRIVVTDLANRGQPLIRYAVGDIGIAATEPCGCGRGLPVLKGVAGRLADFLVRPNGSLVAGVSLIERTLTSIPGIKQMQVVQDSVDDLQIRIVRGPEYSATSEAGLLAEFRDSLNPSLQIRLVFVDTIPRTASGKYRFAICNVPRLSTDSASPPARPS